MGAKFSLSEKGVTKKENGRGKNKPCGVEVELEA